MTEASKSKTVVTPEDATVLSMGPIAARLLMTAADSEGRVGVVESPIEPGVLASPLHIHSNEDGWWYVLEGEFAAQIGDEQIQAGPGSLVRAPRGIPHTYWNPGAAVARYLEIFSPAGLERYFEEVATLLRLTPPDVQGILDLGSQYGLELLWDSVEELQQRHGVKLAAP